jgi:hypothetical protein
MACLRFVKIITFFLQIAMNMSPSFYLPRRVRRLMVFLVVFIILNFCIFVTFPSSPGQVWSRFDRSQRMKMMQSEEEGEYEEEYEKDEEDVVSDEGDTTGDTFTDDMYDTQTTFDSDAESRESSTIDVQ